MIQRSGLQSCIAGNTGLKETKKPYTNGHHCPNLRKGAWEQSTQRGGVWRGCLASFSVASKGPGLRWSCRFSCCPGFHHPSSHSPAGARAPPAHPPTPPARRAGDTPATTWSAVRSSLARSPFLRELLVGGRCGTLRNNQENKGAGHGRSLSSYLTFCISSTWLFLRIKALYPFTINW